jgi:hypothetical protein
MSLNSPGDDDIHDMPRFDACRGRSSFFPVYTGDLPPTRRSAPPPSQALLLFSFLLLL